MTILRDERGRFVKGCISIRKGKCLSEEQKKRLSEVQGGQHHSPSTEFKKGLIPWNKGKKWWTEEIRKMQIESKKGTHFSPKTEFKKDDPRLLGNKINLGRKHTDEWKLNASEKTRIRWKNKAFRRIFSEKMKAHWQNPEYKERTIKATLKSLMKRPTSLEQRFIEIIKKYNLPYKYVGDGRFLIGFKNPDFININGNKSCIEVANRFHHKRNWAEKRKEYFKKLGWDCAVIFEDEFNESKIINDMWF